MDRPPAGRHDPRRRRRARMTGVAEDVALLRAQVDYLLERLTDADGLGATPVAWCSLDREQAREEWALLAGWSTGSSTGMGSPNACPPAGTATAPCTRSSPDCVPHGLVPTRHPTQDRPTVSAGTTCSTASSAASASGTAAVVPAAPTATTPRTATTTTRSRSAAPTS